MNRAAAALELRAEPGTRGVGRARLTYVGLAVTGVAIHAGFALAGTRAAPVDDWLYCGLFFLSVGACAYRGRHGEATGAWRLAAVGVAIWGLAEIVFRLQTSARHAMYPPATQAMLFVAFSLAYTTLGLLARERVRRFDPVLALDGAMAGLAAAALASILLFPQVAAHHPGAVAPPRLFLLGALMGLAFVITVLGLTGWRPGPAWGLIVAAIVVNVGGDVVVVHLAGQNRFHRGSPADTLFITSALLIGLASFFPVGRAPGASAARRLIAPLLGAVAALTVVTAALAGQVGDLAAGLAMAALAITIIRMSVALELLEHSRGEALTDPLTHLGNRRLLMRDLESRLAAARRGPGFVLALFDLDGFKRYNDTFGHPSGDALLSRLASRLVTAVSPGVAYRMGGDEFCAIVEGVGPDADQALVRAREALSEHGDAFSIQTSAGAVRCPSEASTVRAALSIADARMYAAKTTRDLTQAQTRDAVLKMLQERDPLLHDHMRAVAGLSLRVARRLGLDDTSARYVERAAELHDIGKIAVPDAILNKSSTLNAAELRFMRQYPIVGERILRAAPSLAPAAALVRSSHERWDGSGYPDGLRRDEIPIGARIIAACDAYDSMRSVKPYRGARKIKQAVDELRRCAGSQFDPRVVEALLAELEQGAPAAEVQ